jgi:signal transduction histidine kinase
VTDDGPGVAQAQAPDQGHGHGQGQGHGLHGMRERVALHQGTLRAGPAAGEGWLVEATFRPEQLTS